jgi:hypothetical protein
MLTITPHHPANQGSPGDELVHEAFDGQQLPASAVGNGRAVVADGHGTRGGKAEPTGRLCDVALGSQPGTAAQDVCQRRKVDRAAHAAALKAMNPVSGVWNGG